MKYSMLFYKLRQFWALAFQGLLDRRVNILIFLRGIIIFQSNQPLDWTTSFVHSIRFSFKYRSLGFRNITRKNNLFSMIGTVTDSRMQMWVKILKSLGKHRCAIVKFIFFCKLFYCGFDGASYLLGDSEQWLHRLSIMQVLIEKLHKNDLDCSGHSSWQVNNNSELYSVHWDQ